MTQTWTAPAVERGEPERVADERTALQQRLDYHRWTLLGKCAGLTADQLKQRAAAPSSLSLLGLVRHMTEVERWWFRTHGNGERLEFPYDPDQDGADFDDLDAADAAANLDAYRQEIEAADRAVAGRSLDERVGLPDMDPADRHDLRWIYLHMIEEYARHNGHADIIREAIDGVTGS